jgi:hypothetical protein
MAFSVVSSLGVNDFDFARLVQKLTGSQEDVSRAAMLQRRYKWVGLSAYLVCILAGLGLFAFQDAIAYQSLPFTTILVGLLALAIGINLGLLHIARHYAALPGRWAPGVNILKMYVIFGLSMLLGLVLFILTS